MTASRETRSVQHISDVEKIIPPAPRSQEEIDAERRRFEEDQRRRRNQTRLYRGERIR